MLAHAGVASRRAAERLIAEGRVRVNGEVVAELGSQVDPRTDTVEVDGRALEAPPTSHTYLVLYKPVGVVTTVGDPEGRQTVLDLVPTRRRVYPVGRLDFDSEGLLILTDDGLLTYRLTQARYRVEKEYHALVRGPVTADALAALTSGITLEDGFARAVRASLLDRVPDGTWVRVVLHEGRRREVRRLLAAVGCPVLWLRRVRMGPLTLGALQPGEHRRLLPGEVSALKQAVELEGPPRVARLRTSRTGARRAKKQ